MNYHGATSNILKLELASFELEIDLRTGFKN
jgi:hypothetical protein